MKKNVCIFCVLVALTMFLTSCKGGGGGLSNLFVSVKGAWFCDDSKVGDVYGGYYLDDKAYVAFTKDKKTVYYSAEDANTYTSSGNEVKIGSRTYTRDGDTMTCTEGGKTYTFKKVSSKAEKKANANAALEALK